MSLFDRIRPGFLQRLFPGNPLEAPARRLYEGIVAQAREPRFYRECGVPDTVDGRFELLLLHLVLVLRRLGRVPESKDLAQTLVDLTFFDLDQSIRRSGVGDLGVGPRINRMAQAYFGRAAAYEKGLEGLEPQSLEQALRRNLYGTLRDVPDAWPARMAAYLRQEERSLGRVGDEALLAGALAFGAPPGGGET